jgi:polar amino acid transport system substrate-binding protein
MKYYISTILGAAAIAVASMTALAVPASAQEVDQAARAALPAAIRDAGVFKTAIAFAWPPYSYKDAQGQLIGFDADLLRAIAAKLGLKMEIDESKNISITLGGVETGRFHTTPSLAITPERVKVADFVPYYRSQYALLVKKGKTGIDINNLCGHNLAITQGSAQVSMVEALSKECVDAGKKPITTEAYPNHTTTQMSVATGRGEGFVTGLPQAVYSAQLNPQLEVAPGLLDKRGSILGIIVGKNFPELKTAILLAMQSLEADGSYKKLLDKYGVGDGALTAEEIARPAEQYLAAN